MDMDFKKLWFWTSAILATSAILFFVLNILLSFLDGFLGLDFYHFIILGIILFPFLLKYLIKLATEKNSPNRFLWVVILVTFITVLVLAVALLFIHPMIYGGRAFCC